MEDHNIVHSKFPNIDYPNKSFGEYLQQHLKKYANKTLIINAITGDSYNGNEIIKYAETIANSLIKYGITKDDIILFHSNNNIEYAMTQIAAYFLGNTITASKPSHNVYELQNQLTDTGATIVFTSMEKAPTIEEAILSLKDPKQIKLTFVFDGQFNSFIPFNKLMDNTDYNNNQLNQIPYFPIDPHNDTVAIFYTSGTTGLPKGAMLTHFEFAASTEAHKLNSYYGDIISGHYPFGHISGTFNLAINISMGITMVLIENPSIDTILSYVNKYRMNSLGIFPAFIALLISGKIGNYDISSVKYMRTGGSLIPKHSGDALIKKYNLNSFREGYGMTECLAIINDSETYIPGDVGTVAPNMQMKIIDLNTGKSLPKNCDGEICFRGPLMFKGYLNNPQATASTIDKHGWLHTGDVGHYDEEGRLFITDRIKEMVKYRLYTAFPAEIEDCLMKHEAIYEAVVIGVKHITDGEWLRAYVILKKGMEISGEEIVKYIKDRMASHKQLRGGVVFIDDIPRTIIGKPDRQYFKNMCKNEIITDEC